jgi:hypothetical protein
VWRGGVSISIQSIPRMRKFTFEAHISIAFYLFNKTSSSWWKKKRFEENFDRQRENCLEMKKKRFHLPTLKRFQQKGLRTALTTLQMFSNAKVAFKPTEKGEKNPPFTNSNTNSHTQNLKINPMYQITIIHINKNPTITQHNL